MAPAHPVLGQEEDTHTLPRTRPSGRLCRGARVSDGAVKPRVSYRLKSLNSRPWTLDSFMLARIRAHEHARAQTHTQMYTLADEDATRRRRALVLCSWCVVCAPSWRSDEPLVIPKQETNQTVDGRNIRTLATHLLPPVPPYSMLRWRVSRCHEWKKKSNPVCACRPYAQDSTLKQGDRGD